MTRHQQGTRGRRGGTPAAALALLALACGVPPASTSPPQRLVEDQGQVTLGKETRLARSDRSRLLARRQVTTERDISRPAASPWLEGERPRVLLSARAWAGEGTRAQQRAAAANGDTWHAVTQVRPRGVPLLPLVAGAPEPPFTFQVSGLPLPRSPVRTVAEAEIPAGAVLDFGYGLREQSWDSSVPVLFRVHARAGEGKRQTIFEQRLDPSDANALRWHDARVDLSRFAGRRVRFQFDASWEGGPEAVALPVFADPTVHSAGRWTQRPNVLLISLDTLRARSLGTFGYGRDTSPFIDSLAAQGALFESAMTTSATTSPSHMSLFTGLFPVHHGLASGSEWKRKEVPTLATLLREAGYQTAAFTENGFIVRGKGFGDGFASYVENRKYEERPRDARVTFGQARRWLEGADRQPFFVFVHTYEVHTPYEPPERYEKLFRGDGASGPENPVVREMRDHYDREIRYVDDELRAVFGTLEDLGVADSTIVVIAADHGEEFNEHGWLQHGSTVYQEVLHVPMLFWAPGRVPATRIAAPVSLVDVVPTLLSMLGVKAPEDLDGADLSPLMDGSGTLAPRRLFAEARAPLRQTGPNMLVKWYPPMVAVREGNTKFIVHRPPSGQPEPTRVYDLAADPDEQSPRILKGAAKREIEALVDRYLAGGVTLAPALGDEGQPDFDPETEAQLRDLGYLE